MTSKTGQLLETLTDQVAALIGSERWAAMLAAAAKFHSYSANNQLDPAAGAAGNPDSRVPALADPGPAGPQGRARHRDPGAVPVPADQNEPGGAGAQHQHRQQRWRDNRPEKRRTAARHAPRPRVQRLLSQTDGEPLPEITAEPLTGPAPAAMWAALAAQVGAHGYRLERGQCRGANGYTDPAGRLVRVRADVAEAMAARVLAHELAHIECGHCEQGGYRCRGRCQVEAESVAWLISAHFGLDTGDYTLPYVAGWAHAADRAGAVSEVRAAFATVSAAHRRILGALDPATGAGEDAVA